MPCRASDSRLLPSLLILTAVLVVGGVTAHGLFEKILWAGKANASTRGALPGTKPAKLYFMQPPEFMLGKRQTVGWVVTLQDGDASTAEQVRLSFVRFGKDGKTPDTSAAGEIFGAKFSAFGRGLTGNIGYRFRFTLGVPQPLPQTFGIAIELAANAKWPQDGASVHAQLNIPNDSRRPRILPPYDKEVWCYETNGSGKVVPLGGRALDSLDIGGRYIEPVLTPFIDTYAYDEQAANPRYERIYGADALFPNANRGDLFGFHIDGGQIGSNGFAILYTATKLNPRPIPLRVGQFNLSLVAPEPYQIGMIPLDSLGSTVIGPHPFFRFPRTYRTFWLQALIISPFSLEVESTDAIKIRGK